MTSMAKGFNWGISVMEKWNLTMPTLTTIECKKISEHAKYK